MKQESEGLLDRLKARVGQETVFTAPDEMSRASFRMYALALQDYNPLYTDREFARRHGLRDVMAPPTLVCDSWQYLDSDMDEAGDLLARGITRELGGLRAGNDYEFVQPIHPGDIITARWRVLDAWEREGRSGRLVFLQTEFRYYNQRDELLTINRELMFFPMETSPSSGGR